MCTAHGHREVTGYMHRGNKAGTEGLGGQRRPNKKLLVELPNNFLYGYISYCATGRHENIQEQVFRSTAQLNAATDIQILYKAVLHSCNQRKQQHRPGSRGAALSGHFLKSPLGTRHANSSFKLLSMRLSSSFNICGSKSTTERSVPLSLLTV